MKVASSQITSAIAPAIQRTDLIYGSGDSAQVGDIVTIHFTIKAGKNVLSDTKKSGMPFTFVVGSDGQPEFLTPIVSGMKVHGARKCLVPWQLAGGTAGKPPLLPPKMDLEVVVKLISIAGSGKTSRQ